MSSQQQERRNDKVQPPQPNLGPPPTPPTQARTTGGWVDEAEAYLSKSQWERFGVDQRGMSTWSDPHGRRGKGELRLGPTLKTAEGNEERVRQLWLPPIPWSHPLEQAVRIQRERDRDAAGKKVG